MVTRHPNRLSTFATRTHWALPSFYDMDARARQVWLKRRQNSHNSHTLSKYTRQLYRKHETTANSPTSGRSAQLQLSSTFVIRQTYLIAHLVVEAAAAAKVAVVVEVLVAVLILVRVAAAAHHRLVVDNVAAAADHVVHVHLVHNAAHVGQHVVGAAHHAGADHIVGAAHSDAAHVVDANVAAHLGDALIHVLRLNHLLVQVLCLGQNIQLVTNEMWMRIATCFAYVCM